jgi:acyl-CoA synthetase (AMP-forming)/AMP-acid ligase II
MESPYINTTPGDPVTEGRSLSSAIITAVVGENDGQRGTMSFIMKNNNDSLSLILCHSGSIMIVITSLIIIIIVRYWRIDKIIRSLLSLLDLLFSIKRRARQVQTKTPEWNFANTFEEACSKYGDRDFCIIAETALTEEGMETTQPPPTTTAISAGNKILRMTYGQAEKASSAVALWVTSNQNCLQTEYQPGDVVAIFMPNSCEFVVALFGLVRAGIQAALVNTELRGRSLVHALTDALAGNESSGQQKKIKAVLVSPELKPILDSLMESGLLPKHVRIVACGVDCELDPWIETRRYAWMGSLQGRVRWDDTCVYIYTSGTTGLPKASKINHLRMWTGGCVTIKVNQLRTSDRLYCPLPLYHASGCALGLAACLQQGCTLVIRPKFSVRYFSHDLRKYECTCMQYIGEMARYLVAALPNKYDGAQRLRFAYGNGMPSEIWKSFQRRYNIDQINEFYASTEGNVNIFNNTGVGQGACGIVPRGLEWIYPIGLFQHDVEAGDLLRDERTGLCIPAPRGQPGELLGLIQQHDPSRRFDGYTDKSATRSKMVENVRKLGDAYFRSGDLLRQDFWGFHYFCDRVGETFRWKGENVSTSEVARTILRACYERNEQDQEGVENSLFTESIVYGVEVPGNPGRAGMAAVVMNVKDVSTKDGNDMYWTNVLWNSLQKELPRYAQPLFLRVTRDIEKTSTHKYMKVTLQDESFHNCASDAVYIRDDVAKTFVLMDDAITREVISGKRRL